MSQPPISIDLSAKGTVRSKFIGRKGASLLDIRAGGLARGQLYSLWLSTNSVGTNNYLEFADMTQSSQLSSSASFRRDTSRGEQLPFATSTVTNLSGFNFEIRDSFDAVHLQGTLP
jgi:hypothetical protein